MKIGLSVLMIIIGASFNATAQEHCSLLVKVVDANDREVPEARILLEDGNSRVLKAQYKRGGVQLCDLGILPVKVTVGDPNCGGVVLPHIPLDWGETRTIKVVYDRAPCLKDPLPLPVCEILFRFTDDADHALSGVALSPPPPPGLITRSARNQSDRFGRYHLYLDLKKELRALAEREGYEPQQIQLTCTGKLLRHEQIIRMRKKT